MRILAIDYGKRRIGLSISDPLGFSAQKLPTIDRKKNKTYFETIVSIIENDVKKVVLGNPLNANGTESEIGKEVKEFGRILEKKTKVEIILWDERFTSVEAKKIIHQMGIKRKKREDIDQLAAILLLQSYLESN